jgi:hypothetical protein
MLNVIILSVIMLNVIMLSAVAPSIAYDNSKSVLFHLRHNRILYCSLDTRNDLLFVAGARAGGPDGFSRTFQIGPIL